VGLAREWRYDFDYVFPQWDVSIVRQPETLRPATKRTKRQPGQAKRTAEKAS